MHPTLLEVHQKSAHVEVWLNRVIVYLLETTAVVARGGAVDPDVTKKEVMDYSLSTLCIQCSRGCSRGSFFLSQIIHPN